MQLYFVENADGFYYRDIDWAGDYGYVHFTKVDRSAHIYYYDYGCWNIDSRD